MIDIKPLALAAALTAALAAPATAATVPRPEPIPVYDGLLLYPDHLGGKHAFGPADGIDFWLGKGKGAYMPEMAASRPNARGWRASLPPMAYAPTASRWGHMALFDWFGGGWSYWGWGCGCSTPGAPPPETPSTSPVSLPAALWLLMAGLGALGVNSALLYRRRATGARLPVPRLP